MEIILTALEQVFQWQNLLALMIGVLSGLIIGILPGIGPTLGIVLFLPITFGWKPVPALILMGAIYNAAVYGGSISAILINVPGTGPSAATTFDGYPLSEKGQSNLALGASTSSSAVGGIIGVILLMFIAPMLARLALKFGPAENFLLAIFALSILAVVIKGSTVKGLVSAGFGLMLATFGYDLVTSHLRFTFGTLYLQDGIPFVQTLIGLFAIGQALRLAESAQTVSKIGKLIGSILDGVKSTFRHPLTFLRSSVIGTFVGAIPGVGGTAASFLAYTETVRTSKHPETFGKGNVEGVIAAESSNNACVMGSLIPALSLGIPGSEAAAVFLGVMMMHGISPGPVIFIQHANIIYALFAALLVTNFLILLFGLSLGRYLSKITLIPYEYIVPMIISLTLIGSYSLRNMMADVVLTGIFGFIGYIMIRYGYPMVPFILGLILEPMAEVGFQQALLLSAGSYSVFVDSSISKVLVILIVLSLSYPLLGPLYQRMRKR